MSRLFWGIAAVVAIAGPVAAEKPLVADSLVKIKAVGKEGQGNEAAAAAWKTLVKSGGSALLPTLAAFNGANPTAANWLRSAVDAIVQAEAKAGRKLPAKELKEFIETKSNDPSARRIAFELFAKIEKETAAKMLVAMVDDPSLELRRDAIAVNIKEAKGDEKKLTTLFAAARDKDQVEEIAKTLKKTEADITSHFGFVERWHVVGPFDSTKGAGFDKAYPPEAGVDLSATYEGKGGAKVGWKAVTAKPDTKEKEYAIVDLNAELTMHKDAASYAYAVVSVEKDTPVELRAGSITSIKIFVNGKPVFARDEYHHGHVMDQHVGRTTLKAGKNELLLKICQNNQTEQWAQNWAFQLRICDATGGAVPFKLLSPEAK
jgi:hypothetical protein